MSEYQYVAFRAVDGPVSDENLKYMQRQSSRATITPWSFDNEYHFGDFRGNAAEMLRRGYDLHLHYANYGVRTLMIRLPLGLPNPQEAKSYLDNELVSYAKDSSGPGGILTVSPSHETDDLDDLWELDKWIDRLVPLRAELLDGDLRPLYLAHLAMANDSEHDPDEAIEGPVPAGLDQLTEAQRALAELYGFDDAFVAAAARNCPSLPDRKGVSGEPFAWLESLPNSIKNAWLAQLMADPQATVRADLMAEFRKTRAEQSWPTIRLNRTITELEATAQEIRDNARNKAKAKAARERAARVIARKAAPQETLDEVEKLVATKGTASYQQAATLLAELRDALEGTDQAGLAEAHARGLRKKYPSRSALIGALRTARLLK